jgi:hypothetical protein
MFAKFKLPSFAHFVCSFLLPRRDAVSPCLAGVFVVRFSLNCVYVNHKVLMSAAPAQSAAPLIPVISLHAILEMMRGARAQVPGIQPGTLRQFNYRFSAEYVNGGLPVVWSGAYAWNDPDNCEEIAVCFALPQSGFDMDAMKRRRDGREPSHAPRTR